MNYSVYAESTPNPEVMKFVANRMLVDKSIEITKAKQAQGISIAKALFNFIWFFAFSASNLFLNPCYIFPLTLEKKQNKVACRLELLLEVR